jgi:hypothetical protein
LRDHNPRSLLWAVVTLVSPQPFCASPRRILSRDQLLELSRLNRAQVYDASMDVQILRLRRKIESDPSQPDYIKAERGAMTTSVLLPRFTTCA